MKPVFEQMKFTIMIAPPPITCKYINKSIMIKTFKFFNKKIQTKKLLYKIKYM